MIQMIETEDENLPQNLQQCFEKALRLEASLQLLEGVNMAQTDDSYEC